MLRERITISTDAVHTRCYLRKFVLYFIILFEYNIFLLYILKRGRVQLGFMSRWFAYHNVQLNPPHTTLIHHQPLPYRLFISSTAKIKRQRRSIPRCVILFV